MLEALNLPVNDPVLIFSIILFMVLFATVTLKGFNIPSVVGLILSGVALGPFGVGFLERDDSIVLFGTVGLLYIMFMAALEIDIADFKKNSHKSVLFALFSFGVPMGLGILVGMTLLDLTLLPALLLGSMFGSHTLLAFPIAQQLGIAKNKAIAVAVGGSVLTDTAALVTLAIVAALSLGTSNGYFWTVFGLKVAVFAALVFLVVPRVAQWYFRNHEESIPQYIFALAIVFLVAYGAKLAGLEPIIGAFFAGLALNRFIPRSSALMNRIDFIGNAVFVPFFLIGVGMLVDPKVLVSSPQTLFAGAMMVLSVLAGKGLGAWITGVILGQSKIEWQTVISLTIPQAAATLAVAFVGMELGLFDETILNGAVLMVLVTCLLGSLGVERYGAQLAETEADLIGEKDETPQKILVAVEDEADIHNLMELALLLKNKKSEDPLWALHVIKEGSEADDRVALSRRMLEEAVRLGSATENPVHILTRIAPSIAHGISRGARELEASDALVAWDGQLDENEERLFGDVLDTVIKKTAQGVWVTHIAQPLNTLKRISVVLPPRSELEVGYVHLLSSIKMLAKELSAEVVLAGSALSLRYAQAVMTLAPAQTVKTVRFDDWRDLEAFARECDKDQLLIVVGARVDTLSWAEFMDTVAAALSKTMTEKNFIIAYPAQNTIKELQKQIAENRYRELFGGNRRRIRRAIDRLASNGGQR
ncbi:MAG: cation:proton antiporter [Campylobacterales bacterium]